MGIQPLGQGQPDDVRGAVPKHLLIVLDHAGRLHKVIAAQGTEKTGAASRGKGVTRASPIISNCHWTVGTQEHGTRIRNALGNVLGLVPALDFQVFFSR